MLQQRTARSKRRVATTYRRRHGRLEQRFVTGQRPFWRRLAKSVISRVDDQGDTDFSVDDVFQPAEWTGRFNRLIVPVWNLTIWSGIELEREWIGVDDDESQSVRQATVGGVDLDNPAPPPSIEVEVSPFLRRKVKGFLRGRMVGVWKRVGRTTRDRLRSTIARGISEGLTITEMERDIRKTLSSLSRHEARRIARTETTGAMNTGQQAERERVGVDKKEWLANLDDRTRDDHRAANGQVRANDKPFSVGGEALMYPGDSRGSAKQVVHCRCASVAHFE